jgi:hypothetical protein
LEKRNHRRNDLNESLLAAVQHEWKTQRELIRTPGPATDAFRSIVSYLTAQLVSEAIDLQSKIALE